jgi:hypothetical protein
VSVFVDLLWAATKWSVAKCALFSNRHGERDGKHRKKYEVREREEEEEGEEE